MKKLNLNSLKVKSFVTDLQNKNASTVKGGYGGSVLLCRTFGGGGVCDGPPPTKNDASFCICK